MALASGEVINYQENIGSGRISSAGRIFGF